MDGERRLAMVDRDIRVAADRLGNAGAGAAAAGEAVNEETLKHQRASLPATCARSFSPVLHAQHGGLANVIASTRRKAANSGAVKPR